MGKINPKWAAYNNLHNEGAEGYNPHAKYLQDKQQAWIEPKWSVMQDQISKLRNICNATSTTSSRYEELRAEIAKLTTEADAEYASWLASKPFN